jgi:hypothetical protein
VSLSCHEVLSVGSEVINRKGADGKVRACTEHDIIIRCISYLNHMRSGVKYNICKIYVHSSTNSMHLNQFDKLTITH